LDEALVLAVEVLVEGAPGDGRVAGDVSDRGAGVAVFGDGLGQSRDQALALVAGDELPRQAMPSRRQPSKLRRVLRRLERLVGWISQENRRYRSGRAGPRLTDGRVSKSAIVQAASADPVPRCSSALATSRATSAPR